ncbi:ADC synthase [Pilobolus umbonatus]|nr:ADC synthase [Pilobolus umbonatus]
MVKSMDNDISHIRTLIIDNYDSYTFNLLQLFTHQQNVIVIRNDQFTWDEFTVNVLPQFDNIIISPGPGRPEREADFGICTQLLETQLDPTQKQHHRPIFGVCLGHQGIGHLLGANVTYASRIMHGRMSQVHITQPSSKYQSLLEGCPSPFWAVRYHSLVVDKHSLPDDLILTAFCFENDADMDALKNAEFIADNGLGKENGTRNHFLNHPDHDEEGEITVMAFQHKSLPLWGVQFHPESVSTEYGRQMIKNFQEQTYQWMIHEGHRIISEIPLDQITLSYSAALPHTSSIHKPPHKPLRLFVKSTQLSWIEPDSVADELLSAPLYPDQSFSWLDSSRKSSPYSNLSILSIKPAITLTYSTLHRQLNLTYNNKTEISYIKSTLFDTISDLLPDTIQYQPLDSLSKTLELEFQGGFIGYFGYEMKRESMEGYVVPKEQECHCPHHTHDISKENCCRCVEEPDAAFHYVDRFLVFDHTKKQMYLCCVVKNHQEGLLSQVGCTETEAMGWIKEMECHLSRMAETIRMRKSIEEIARFTPVSSACTTPTPDMIIPDVFTPDVEHDNYLNNIERCIDNIKEGEAYEICLTTRFRLPMPSKHITLDPANPTLWRLYSRHLRKNNPAPFSALLMFPRLGILCSSPERFLKVSSNHVAEMKPIKGTVARILQCICQGDECDYGDECEERQSAEDRNRKQQLWQDVKERAENLMIVDLIRNDLAQVCEPSSVCVPKLMHVETYEKVHHLVSTIRGTLYPHVNSVQALKTCFPPGSMTGAPKLRSVQLLDALENNRPRGVYSGCLGYFSLNGAADFNVVIRTAVVTSQSEDKGLEISVSGGGAITFLSDPEQEWKEALLKTRSVAPSVKEFLKDQ